MRKLRNLFFDNAPERSEPAQEAIKCFSDIVSAYRSVPPIKSTGLVRFDLRLCQAEFVNFVAATLAFSEHTKDEAERQRALAEIKDIQHSAHAAIEDVSTWERRQFGPMPQKLIKAENDLNEVCNPGVPIQQSFGGAGIFPETWERLRKEPLESSGCALLNNNETKTSPDCVFYCILVFKYSAQGRHWRLLHDTRPREEQEADKAELAQHTAFYCGQWRGILQQMKLRYQRLASTKPDEELASLEKEINQLVAHAEIQLQR